MMRRVGMVLSGAGIALAVLSVAMLLVNAFVGDTNTPLYVGIVAVTLAVPVLVAGFVVLALYVLLLRIRS